MKRHISALLLLLLLLVPVQSFASGVVMNFTNVDISTMAKFMSDLTGKNFVMDDRVTGKISVFSPTRLSTDEAFNLFTSVLELKGFTLIQAGRFYKIVPISVAKQSGARLYSGNERAPVNDSYIARVITLDNIPAQDAVTFLQPVVSKDGFISAFGPANMLLVVDSAFNIDKILDIIHVIDADKQRNMPEVIYLKNASADAAVKTIQEWLGNHKASSSSSSSSGQGQQASSQMGPMVIADTRLNAIIVAGSDSDKADIKKMVDLLDVLPPTASSKVNVYFMENADATDIAKILDGVVKGISAAAAQGESGQATPAAQSPFENSKITITADKASNALIIMASPNDYQSLLQVIKKLDIRRRQVFVEAIIAEVSLDKLRDLGLEWGLMGMASNSTASVLGTFDPQGTINTTVSTLQTILTAINTSGIGSAFTFGNNPANFMATLHALESKNILNVLSTPTILTSDNKEADIKVGENVPLITGSTITGSGLDQQSVERKDIGIELKITPQITEGEYIKLDIYQEVSALAPNKGQATDLVYTTRKAQTSVAVRNKETVVIGGLIQDQETITENKIPFLGSIPILGYLFKTKSKERTKTDLIIFLTPHIIKDARDLTDITKEQKDKFGKVSKTSDKEFSQGLDIPKEIDKEFQNLNAPQETDKK
ncbi:MAG: type II secretion system secretin GspD [Desulfuromonadales bacterium]|nr:type II secretion system secretin GspD [Desulfuromonadales bacterium]